MTCEFGCTGTLTIDGYSLNTYAWDAPNLVRLWAEADVRGENKLLPGAPGRRGYPTRLEQASFDLPFWITGTVDPANTPYALPWSGLESNLNLLWGNVFQPVTTGRGVRAAVLTLPSGTVRTASVQVEPLTFPDDVWDAFNVAAVIHLTVVTGRFV